MGFFFSRASLTADLVNAKMAQSCILLPDTAGQKQLWENATLRQFVQLSKKKKKEAKLMEKHHRQPSNQEQTGNVFSQEQGGGRLGRGGGVTPLNF